MVEDSLNSGPSVFRRSVIELAHDGVAGHLGISETYKRTLCYYRPGIKTDVTHYIKFWQTCQIVEKPSQTITTFLLKPIPIVSDSCRNVHVGVVLLGSNQNMSFAYHRNSVGFENDWRVPKPITMTNQSHCVRGVQKKKSSQYHDAPK